MISNLYSLQTSTPVNAVKPRPFTELDFASRDGYYKNYFQKSEPNVLMYVKINWVTCLFIFGWKSYEFIILLFWFILASLTYL